MIKTLAILFCLVNFISGKAQTSIEFADSIRKTYAIPELAYAVVSSDSIFELQAVGFTRSNAGFQAKLSDRFHIGSNTKAITSFIAALLVQQKQISWDTKIFDLFPELKGNSKKVYRDVTLQNLLTFRGKLPSFSYDSENPVKEKITGDNAHQRYLLTKYFISQQPMKESKGLTPSNADFIVAGLMLEKASGKTYKNLVNELGECLKIKFGFDYPNTSDTLQTWGHDKNLNPIPAFDNYKLNWLLSAGNINVTLPDYIKFVQLILKGLKGENTMLPNQTFDSLLFQFPLFSYGWFNKADTVTNHHIAFNEGNAGAFVTQVYIIKEIDKSYIIFTNAATEKTSEGIAVLLNHLKKKYGE